MPHPTPPLFSYSQQSAAWNGYIERIVIQPSVTHKNHIPPIPSIPISIDDNDNDNDTTTTTTTDTTTVRWTFHICYSPSYKQPILYFNAHDHHSGSPLGLSQILSHLVSGTDSDDNDNDNDNNSNNYEETTVRGSITHEHHPVLHTPFYMLHPCQTEDIMRTILVPLVDNYTGMISREETNNEMTCFRYLVAWLCVAGRPFPSIAFSPSQYATHLSYP